MFKVLLKIFGAGFGVVILAFGVWWVASAPPPYLTIAEPYSMGPVPEALLAVKAEGDPIGERLETLPNEIRGYDEVILQEDRGRAFVTVQDGWIWKLDLNTGEAERFVDAPLMAAGAVQHPDDPNALAFCASHLHGETYPEGERVGIYRLDLETREITPILLRVPLPPKSGTPQAGNEGIVYTAETENRLSISAMDDTNSRPIAFANDLAVSSDGKRFYFSEPFAYEGAAMGGGTVGEAISLGNNGLLWSVDTETQTAALVVQGYNFVDGVLLEENEGIEESVIFTETPKFRIMRAWLRGERAGQDEILWDSLPGMPDGMDRDADGNIWIGMLKKRSGLITWLHANPWIKPLFLRIPPSKLPVTLDTSVLALSPDGSTPLWYAEHAGEKISDIAVAIPGENRLYLANFTRETPGVHWIPNPLATGTAAENGS